MLTLGPAKRLTLNLNDLNTQQELFILISEGNEEAFNEFYQKMLPGVTPLLSKLLKSEAAVKDVLQEALIRFWLNRHKLPDIINPGSWLSRIIYNEAYRYLQKNAANRIVEPLEKGEEPGKKQLSQTEIDVSYRETQRLIRQAVVTLSPRQKAIYQLSRENGLSVAEIAAKLGVSANYVRKTLALALQLIQKRLMESGISLPLLLILMP